MFLIEKKKFPWNLVSPLRGSDCREKNRNAPKTISQHTQCTKLVVRKFFILMEVWVA